MVSMFEAKFNLNIRVIYIQKQFFANYYVFYCKFHIYLLFGIDNQKDI